MDPLYREELVALNYSEERIEWMVLDPAFKEKWLSALRSGRWTQGKGFLNLGSTYCCLGVACDVLDPDGWVEGLSGRFSFSGASGFPETETLKQMGWVDLSAGIIITDSLREKFPRLALPRFSGEECVELTALNDHYDWTFEEIADLLEYVA